MDDDDNSDDDIGKPLNVGGPSGLNYDSDDKEDEENVHTTGAGSELIDLGS